MGIFGGGGDVIDFTHLQKRGIVKKSPEIKDEVDFTVDKNGFVNLSASNQVAETPISIESLPSPPASSNNSSLPTSFFGFMDNPAPVIPEPALASNNSDLSSMRIKMEDLEYKFERFLDRMTAVEQKIEDVLRNIR